MSDNQNINLRIGESMFPIVVPREDEEIYRNAEKMINQKLSTYAKKYPTLSVELHLKMALIDLSVNQVRLDNQNNVAPFIDLMSGLKREIEVALSKK